MEFNFDFNIDFGFEETQAENTDFVKMCELAGYFTPYPKQVEMKDFCFSYDQEVVRMILGARKYGKTDYITIMGSVEKLRNNPNYKILLITKENGRGTEIVSEVREILKRLGCQFKNKAKKSIRLAGAIGKEPNLISLTVRSKGVRGRHPDLVIMEDPITPDDVSETERKRVKKMYDEVIKLTHNIVVIGQPVHKLDLYQTLREIVPTLTVPYGSIPELDADLDAERAAGVDEFSIQASYYLNIMDSQSLPFGGIKEVNFAATQNIAWIDPSHKGKDYTAIVLGGRNLSDFILTGFCFKKAWYDCLPEIEYIYKNFPVYHFVVETNGLGELPLIEFKKIDMPAVGFNTTQNKYAKILNAAAFCNDLKLSKLAGLPPEFTEAQQIFIEQTKNYEYNSEHDDAPDAAASLISYIRGL